MFGEARFKVMALLLLSKEAALAFSTYSIALGGRAIGLGKQTELLSFITLFFLFAVLGYLLSSCVAYCNARLKIALWGKYVLDTFQVIRSDQGCATKENMGRTIGWLTSEAPSTLNRMCDLFVSMISIYLNVTFTLVVFALTLGAPMALAMLATIALSIGIASSFGNAISKIGRELQSERLQVTTAIAPMWANFLLANTPLIDKSSRKFSGLLHAFLRRSTKYTLIEQMIAGLPIYLCVPVIIYSVFNWHSNDASSLVMLVAVLPRSLQLLGNVHGMSLMNANFILLKSQYEGLRLFAQKLPSQHLADHINFSAVTVTNVADGKIAELNAILSGAVAGDKSGRYRIDGPNGAGKSTILRLVKSKQSEAIIVSADIPLDIDVGFASTGEGRVSQLLSIIKNPPRVLLLDEWDANLDEFNRSKIDQTLDLLSRHIFIVEARHRHN